LNKFSSIKITLIKTTLNSSP